MRNRSFLIPLLLLLSMTAIFSGCAKEVVDTPRQLFIPVYELTEVDTRTPVWFDPATGEVTCLCPHCPHQCDGEDADCTEKVHGDACPFTNISLSNQYILGDTLYYFCIDWQDDAKHVELYAYSLTDGNRTQLFDTVLNADVSSTYLFNGEYLYQLDTHVLRGQNNTDKKYVSTYRDLQRLHLPSGTWEDVSGQSPPWQIEDGVGYYLLSESDDSTLTGVYSQPLYTSNDTPPEETLLFHEVTMDATPLLTKDAIYWIGSNKLPENEDDVANDLYRYDRQTQEITLLAEDFGSRFSALNAYLQEDDGFLYGICEEGTKEVLTQVCIADGTKKALYTEEDGWSIDNSTLEVIGDYVIVDLYQNNTLGKFVYNTITGDRIVYVLG